MNYRLVHSELILYNKDRVLSLCTSETARQGFVTIEFLKIELGVSNSDLAEIRDLLILEGKIESVP